MVITWRDLLAAALATVLASSCSNSPPGAGFINREKGTFTADEKPAIRDDLHMPSDVDSGDAKFADRAALNPTLPADNAGTGGGNSGQAKPAGSSSNPSATPPKTESSGEAGAQGGTKPSNPINTGTPRSPQ